MLVVHVALVAMLMAVDAAEGRKVALCRVAFAAKVPLIAVTAGVDWEMLLVVIEIGVPIGRRVAIQTLLRIAFVMIRIVRVVKVGLMTEPAIRWCVLKLAIGMTAQTIHRHVRSG